jgi:hypothetical protein
MFIIGVGFITIGFFLVYTSITEKTKNIRHANEDLLKTDTEERRTSEKDCNEEREIEEVKESEQ